MTGLQGMDPNLIRQYSSAFGAYVPGDFAIDDTIRGGGTSGTVIWSYLSGKGLTYVVDDHSGWPVELLARLVQAQERIAMVPVTRYSQLMEKLLAFYKPADTRPGHLEQDIKQTLKEAHAIIMQETTSGDEDITYMIAGRMLKLREQKHPNDATDGVIQAIQDFAQTYVTVIFKDMAGGDRATLQHRFNGMAGSCAAVYNQMRRDA